MGKFKNRGGGGGRGGGGNGRGGHTNGVQKPGYKDGKKCNNCGKSGHFAKDCYSKKGNNNNQSQNENKKQKGNKNENTNTTCLKCGYSGHETKNCTAKELPEEQWCECGCPYHRSSPKCHWGQDPCQREQDQKAATGMICRWCKNEGDGMHTFESCLESKKFRSAMLSKIEREYDTSITWCWHCGSKDHRTRACTNEKGTIGKAEWTAKVNRIIQQWVDHDISQSGLLLGDRDDEFMIDARPDLRAPAVEDIPWCLLCETCDHATKRRPDAACDMSKYERNCPQEFKSMAFDTKQPFIPGGTLFGHASAPVGTIPYGAPDIITNGYITVSCMNPSCGAQLQFPRHLPTLGYTKICPLCRIPNPHPHTGHNSNSQTDILKTVFEGIKAMTGIGREEDKRREAYEKRKDDYKHRPSSALPATISNAWPETQPAYHDYGARRESTGEPLFHPDHNFNLPGNHQLYFPAIRVRLSPEDLEIQKDPRCPVNYSIAGFELRCLKCNALGLVRDGESDVVMVDTEAANAVGCGVGVREFWGTGYRDWCKCLRIFNQEPAWEFVRPRT